MEEQMTNSQVTSTMKVEEILRKEPFIREVRSGIVSGGSISLGDTIPADVPNVIGTCVSQEQYLMELNPDSHDIHRDENVPSIVAKIGKDNYKEIKDVRIALAYQKKIVEKQTLYVCGKDTKFTLCNPSPDNEMKEDYIDIKTTWKNRNYDVARTLCIMNQKSVGDAAIIHYFDKSGKIRPKNVSFLTGYTLLPHYDRYDQIDIFGVLYSKGNGRVLDVYDKKYMTSYSLKSGDKEWVEVDRVSHGFNEVPVSYIRGEVAWDNAQSTIEALEIIYNIYSVIMKRHGWGMLYIKGNVDTKMKKIAGSVILQDNSDNPNSTAEYLSPSTPTGMENLLADLRKQIQIMTGTIFLTPEDVRMSGDISGAAIKMMNSSAYEKAMLDAKLYDVFMDSMIRIFVFGYSNERKKIAEFSRLNIRAELDVWIPQSDTEIVSNLVQLKGSGLISVETGTEVSPYSTPDEVVRIKSEAEDDNNADDNNIEPNNNQLNNNNVNQS